MKKLKFKRALLIIDLQNDFCPGGALGIPQGDKIVPKVNKYIKIFVKNGLPIFFTHDWHPVRTKHFKDFGGTWPVHCIQNSWGAKLHSKLRIPKEAVLFYKGLDPHIDAYSAFQAENASGLRLPKLLRIMGVKELYIGGLATDYCVKFSVRDAIKLGFKVKILTDAIEGVNLKADDSQKAMKEMLKLGVKKIILKDLEEKL